MLDRLLLQGHVLKCGPKSCRTTQRAVVRPAVEEGPALDYNLIGMTTYRN